MAVSAAGSKKRGRVNCLTVGGDQYRNFQQIKSGGTHQFEERYFRQDRFICVFFLILSCLGLFFAAVLDEIEFEHYGDCTRRRYGRQRSRWRQRAARSLFRNPVGRYISTAVLHPPIGLGNAAFVYRKETRTMSFTKSAIYPANPNTVRGASTKLSSSKDKIVYANGKTIIVS